MKKLTILVVEKSGSVTPIQFILEQGQEWTVVSVDSIDRAEAYTKEQLPDAIILDVSTGEDEGFVFCQKIKAREETANIPVIFISSSENTQSIVLGFNIGAVDFIRKPYYPMELVARIRTHLRVSAQKREILQKNREVRELIQVLCHDLANQHGVIAGLVNLAEMMPEKTPGYLVRMNKSLDTVAAMIEQVRQFRSIEDGKAKFELKTLNLKSAAEDAVGTLESRLSSKKITAVVEISEEIEVLAEPVSFINSVLCNLMTNAIKFSFEGGKIFLSCKEAAPGYIQFMLRDQGMGMPDSIRENLFRMDKPTTRRGTSDEAGTGYGMPLVKKFIHLYNGRIFVESIEKSDGVIDHGTTVNLLLKSG